MSWLRYKLVRQHASASIVETQRPGALLIDSSGRVFIGRDMRYQGAHAGGANNRGNIGVCLVGNFDIERPSRAAVAALDRLVAALRSRYSIDGSKILPHRHWKNTECPGRYLMGHLEQYR